MFNAITVEDLHNFLTGEDQDRAQNVVERLTNAETDQFPILLHPIVLATCADLLAEKISRDKVGKALMRVVYLDGFTVPEKELMTTAVDYFGRNDCKFANALIEAMKQKDSASKENIPGGVQA